MPPSASNQGPNSTRRLAILAILALLSPAHTSSGSPATAIATPAAAPTTAEDALEAIDRDEIEQRIRYLASDRFEGRDTPMRGLDRAAEYIASELASYGLEPISDSETPYYYPWGTRALIADPSCSLTTHTPGNEQARETYALGEDYVPCWVSGELEVQAPVVFAGYGITARDERYDDYGGRTIHGKIALVMSHEPRQDAKGKRFEGPLGTEHASILAKAENAAEHGARGMIIVKNPLHHDDTGPMGDQLPRMPAGGRGGIRPPTSASIPVVSVSLAVAEAILGQPIEPLQTRIDRTLRNKLISADGVEVKIRVKLEQSAVTTQNVAAFHRGSDSSMRDEVVVLGAHYDHIGQSDRTGETNFGADDNGSGTAALLEIAQAFGTSKIETPRTILFLFFSGEEKGLIGSKRYVDQPVIPLDHTVAMLNMDMVGRNDPRRIDVLGANEHPKLYASARRAAANRRVGGLRIEKGGQEYFQRSDHFPFHERGVPVLFFFSGVHDDYHRPTDTAEKIHPEKIARVARTIFLTAADLAGVQ